MASAAEQSDSGGSPMHAEVRIVFLLQSLLTAIALQELQALQAEVSLAVENQIHKSSRTTYQASQRRFFLWALEKEPHILQPAFRDGLAAVLNTPDGPDKKKAVDAFFALTLGPPVDRSRPPLDFVNFSGESFTVWIASLRKKNGERPGYTSINSHRSAMWNLFRDFSSGGPGPLQGLLQGDQAPAGCRRTGRRDAHKGRQGPHQLPPAALAGYADAGPRLWLARSGEHHEPSSDAAVVESDVPRQQHGRHQALPPRVGR